MKFKQPLGVDLVDCSCLLLDIDDEDEEDGEFELDWVSGGFNGAILTMEYITTHW